VGRSLQDQNGHFDLVNFFPLVVGRSIPGPFLKNIAEAGADGDDDDEEGKSEEGESEHENEDGEGGGGQRTQLQKRRQMRSFCFTTQAVVRIESHNFYCNVSSWGPCRL
jgi:hypothetical protein